MSTSPPPLHFQVFLASPGDVPEERKAARHLMETVLPKDPLLPCRVSFDVVGWDGPAASTPMPAHITPQDAIIRFKTRPAEYDIVLVILRGRMGTVMDVASLQKPDGSPYLSGTELEFEDAWNATPRPEIMIYRCDTIPSVPLNDPRRKEKQAQYDTLDTFLSRFQNPDGSWNGGVNDFRNAADFRGKLETYLKHIVVSRNDASEGALPGKPTVTVSTPPVDKAPNGISKPVVLPNPTLGTLFKGRDDVLATLRERLLAGAPTAITASYHALHGPGGIGKTRAAVEYAHAHKNDYSALLFAIADTPDAMAHNLANLSGALGLSERRDRPQQPRHVAASHQPAWRGGTADAPRAGHRRGQLRQGPSERRDPPQQPRRVAASHQPARRGGTADAPHGGYLPGIPPRYRTCASTSGRSYQQLRRAA